MDLEHRIQKAETMNIKTFTIWADKSMTCEDVLKRIEQQGFYFPMFGPKTQRPFKVTVQVEEVEERKKVEEREDMDITEFPTRKN